MLVCGGGGILEVGGGPTGHLGTPGAGNGAFPPGRGVDWKEGRWALS